MVRFPQSHCPYVACQSYIMGQIKRVPFWKINQPKRETKYLQLGIPNTMSGSHPD